MATEGFDYVAHPARVLFGSGTASRVGDEVRRLGGARVLLLAGTSVSDAAEQVCATLGPLLAARFDGAAMHTPVEVTEKALAVLREAQADCLVAIGGGSTTGLSKALALRTDLPQIILPTTYAGSEVTPVLGETSDGQKVTTSSAAVLPETVIYDVEFSRSLPLAMTVTSAVNALAHAVEALYSPQANPIIDGFALEAIARTARALPLLVGGEAASATDVAAGTSDPRADLLRAAWLAGTCLGAAGMGLHHKLCHVLGGSFGLPHAETHTVILPHAMAYNASAAPQAMRRVAEALGVEDAPSGLFDLIATAGGPTSLRALGLAEADIPRVAQLAAAQSYPNPRELTEDGIESLLRDAWHGRRPAASSSALPDTARLTEQVVGSFDHAPDPRTRELITSLVRHLHTFAAENDLTQKEWQQAIDFLTRTGQICSDTRQEFVLLSDTLGVSSVVDMLANSRTPGTTPSAVLGPFYVEGPPDTEQGADVAGGLPGTPLWVDVHIADAQERPIGGAVVDVWQSNDDGFYDVQLPDLDGPVLRARFRSDEAGRLRFWSILPSPYPIPDDGPVGAMLAALGRHPYRAPHLHFMISAPGYRRLVTQLFVAGGEYLDSDTVFGVKDALIVDFAEGNGPTPDGRSVQGAWRSVEFTFRLAAEGRELPVR
ncbi:iron-containing alcohol dehydrogenase [Actinocrinis sp.]|uniref:iron-containing alcohol dehydrogenase n=1 Tax=Actinocrinis sp. TaxID=1920516 RepID=UPI002CC08D9B|nr:iron-containing alcohol dehydrogenase [Actinocrinis sp.]HXR73635.1 iron-containing alcohol dehydrogenase [Actinocrinis sp.]